MSNPRDLKNRYPYMFDGENSGLRFYKGWHALLEKLCADIDELLDDDKQGFQWTQIKEKFGTLRLYWRMQGHSPPLRINVISPRGVLTEYKTQRSRRQRPIDSVDPGLHEKIGALINQAERAAFETCILCGAPGKHTQFKGHVMTLCKDHALQRRRGSLPDYLLDAGEGE